jgi:hypothetical protein
MRIFRSKSAQSSQNASYNGSEDMWGDEGDHEPIKAENDVTKSDSAIVSTVADDSIAIVEPPAPVIFECITLTDSPLETIIDDDDDIRIIAEVISPSRRSTATVAATTVTNPATATGWLCAKKQFQ